jgi:anti-sigma factor RsiW
VTAVIQRSPDAVPSTWRATGLEPPVFLDRSGRRARLVGAVGTAAVTLASAWLVTLVLGASGTGPLNDAAATARPAAGGHAVPVVLRATQRDRRDTR